MSLSPTAAIESFETTPHEPSLVEDPTLVCECGSERAKKHGTCDRSPHGRATVQVQRYRCRICGGTFSSSLSYIEDDHQHKTWQGPTTISYKYRSHRIPHL